MSLTCENDPLMSMSIDFYYSTETQDRYGKEVKNWQYGQTLIGYAQVLGSVDIKALKTGMFFEYNDKLIGRTRVSPAISAEGLNYPITSIVATNIVDTRTGTQLYVENSGEFVGQPTVYDIFAIEPYVNPWNEIEYYKILFNRSDRQGLTND